MRKESKIAIVAILTVCVIGVFYFITSNSGRTPNEHGIVAFDSWEISQFNQNTCVAGTTYESGAVLFSIIRKADSNVYAIRIQSSNWSFSDEALDGKIFTTISFDNNTSLINTTSVLKDKNTIEMLIPERTFEVNTVNVSAINLNFGSGNVLTFEVGKIQEALKELNSCIVRAS